MVCSPSPGSKRSRPSQLVPALQQKTGERESQSAEEYTEVVAIDTAQPPLVVLRGRPATASMVTSSLSGSRREISTSRSIRIAQQNTPIPAMRPAVRHAWPRCAWIAESFMAGGICPPVG
jgi:hypothetical protein